VSDEQAFLNAIRANPDDDTARLVYADWLDERDDARGQFVRLHLALRSVAPDHAQRAAGEQELSALRKARSPDWLTVIEPERAHLYATPSVRPSCACFPGLYEPEPKQKAPPVEFHIEPQDTECDAWKKLCDLVERAALDGREEFRPAPELAGDDWIRIVTLPPTIAKLKNVKRLILYGSHLVCIPPEIGEMTNLVQFVPYTSYRLHWYPYEITRCKNLQYSTVSTRSLYGNAHYRPPFPRLTPGMHAGRVEPAELPLKCSAPGTVRRCSVCDKPFEDRRQHRVWISLYVATDVLPLLVNACSAECIGRLPPPREGYTNRPHRGGSSRQQQQTQY
jgi:uncharacterized protein (TIGR02996 family)